MILRPKAVAEPDFNDLRAHVMARLVERRAEIEAAMRFRMYAVSDPEETGDPTYVENVPVGLSAAFDFVRAGLEGDGEDVPVPAMLLVQARLAARNNISLDTVLRRYFAGYTLLGDLLVQEAGDEPFTGVVLQPLMQAQARLFDRLVAAVTEEHSREWERPPGSTEERRVRRVEDLLDGETTDREDLEYDFDIRHLGLIAAGSGGVAAVRDFARELDCRLLLACRDERTAWGWLGTRGELDCDRLHQIAAETMPEGLLLALGEPAQGLSGWRLTHRQASAALSVAMRSGHRLIRYADVALLASALGDEVFEMSLRQIFLDPLMRGRGGGATLLETLRAYFAAERNVSSAAASLGASRQTVINRLNAVEERLGRPIGAYAVEMEAALRVEEFDRLQAGGGAKPPQRPFTTR